MTPGESASGFTWVKPGNPCPNGRRKSVAKSPHIGLYTCFFWDVKRQIWGYQPTAHREERHEDIGPGPPVPVP